jgi:predicted ATPase
VAAHNPKQERHELHREFYDVEDDLTDWTRDRLLTLSKETRLILGALAAFRKPCSLSTLNSLFPELSVERISDALEQLQRDRLVLHNSQGYLIAEAIRNRANNSNQDSE